MGSPSQAPGGSLRSCAASTGSPRSSRGGLPGLELSGQPINKYFLGTYYIPGPECPQRSRRGPAHRGPQRRTHNRQNLVQHFLKGGLENAVHQAPLADTRTAQSKDKSKGLELNRSCTFITRYVSVGKSPSLSEPQKE